VLGEAAAKQVNQNGGYPGMTPAIFYGFLQRLADEEGVSPEKSPVRRGSSWPAHLAEPARGPGYVQCGGIDPILCSGGILEDPYRYQYACGRR